MTSLHALARRLAFYLWRVHARSDLTRTSRSVVLGLDLTIPPGVLHPTHFASSRFLAHHLVTLDVGGRAALDLGAGSGLLALVLARGGARVTATDINPDAVACVRINAERNSLGDRVEALESDVFRNLPLGDRFDLIVSNPPFFPREPTTPDDRAFAAGAGYRFFSDLAAGLDARLTAAGRLLMVLSTDADVQPVDALIKAQGFEIRTLGERRGLFETLRIREFVRFQRGT